MEKLAGLSATEVPEETKGQFRTSCLLNAAETGPYMHNGSLKTLDDVVKFYNNGGGATGKFPGAKDPKIRAKLSLTDQEMADLVEFLHSLTGAQAYGGFEADNHKP